LIAAASLLFLPVAAFAQADQHHPDAGAAPAAAAPAAPAPTAGPAAAPVPMAGGMAEQCAAMMPMMTQMMQMMATMQGGATAGTPMAAAGMSDAGKAYMDAMRKMDPPMMAAVQGSDPDVAFVTAMIPHHQGAIDMAKAVLQYGKDERVKEWANEIIKAQEAEIAKLQEWLKDPPK
jgi:uncharacterized protein (DUF305 family)